MATSTPRLRLAIILVLGIVPWTVILIGETLTLVSPVGFFDVSTGRILPIWTLLSQGGGLPRAGDLFPASFLLFVGAIGSGVGEVLASRVGWRVGDPRVTAGLLTLAALTHLSVSYAVVHRLRYTPLPVGVLVVLGTVWWLYGRSLRVFVGHSGEGGTE